MPRLSRRSFLKRINGIWAVSLASSLVSPIWAQSAPGFADSFWECPRSIFLRHHSGELVKVVFWQDGRVIVSAHNELSWFMRDRNVNRAILINTQLLDVLYAVGGWLNYFGVSDPIILNSGYRDPQRNLTIEGAARDSLHTVGGAVDIRIQGVSDLQVSRFGVWLSAGGVGWYPGKVFTHLDIGKRRIWQGS